MEPQRVLNQKIPSQSGTQQTYIQVLCEISNLQHSPINDAAGGTGAQHLHQVLLKVLVRPVTCMSEN